MNEEYGNFVQQNGIPLEDKMGVKEFAFPKDKALELLSIMKKYNMGASGGDVVKEKDGNFGYAMDNWSYGRVADESEDQYVTRSISKAESYIKSYPEKQGEKYYYVVV